MTQMDFESIKQIAARRQAQWQEQQKTKDFLEWLSQGNNQGESMKQAAARQKAEWDEEQKTKKFIEWYRAGVEELSTTESGQQNGN
jgi:hypothetical protein